MGLLEKIKDFFYDDVEEPVEVHKVKKTKKEKNVEKNIDIFDIEKEQEKYDEEQKIVKTRKTIVDDELPEENVFRTGRRFNFPMDFDENDFQEAKIKQELPKEPEVREQPRIERVTRSEPVVNQPYSRPYTQSYSSSTYKKETKKFKPTPVISPIYGVLNENYRKEDIVDTRKSRTIMEQKSIDFDSVRKKAYAELDDKIEENRKIENNIFYNIAKEQENEEKIKEDYEEKPYKKDEVIITYGQVDDDIKPAKEIELKKQDDNEDLDIPKITRSKKIRKIIEDDEDDDSDLFKIIDNMYNDEDEEDE